MSRVSHTTQERRSLLAAAGEGEGEGGTRCSGGEGGSSTVPPPPGVVSLGSFHGHIRVVEIVTPTYQPATGMPPANADQGESSELPSVSVCPSPLQNMVAWCAEQDGSVALRRVGNAGLLTTRAVDRIQPVGKNVFVQSIKQAGRFVFCGSSDGYLRGYDALSKKLIFEKKRHAGAITCMESAQMLDMETNIEHQLLFTGSDDFKIMVWDVCGSDTKVIGLPLMGHSNAVKCLHVAPNNKDGKSENHLYSGSDDGFVRRWDYSLPSPRSYATAPFPLFCHREGVRSLSLDGDNLYACAAGNGGILVRSIVDGETHARIRLPHDGFTSMNLVPQTHSLWTANGDGKLSLWSTDDFSLQGSLAHHGTHVVPGIVTVAQSVATRLILFSNDGKLLEVTAQSDSFLDEKDSSTATGTQHNDDGQFQEQVQEVRLNMITNHQSIHERKEKMTRLRKLEAHEKKIVVASLARESMSLLKRDALSKVLLWHQRTKGASKRGVVGDILLRTLDRKLRYTFFLRWMKYIQGVHRSKTRQQLSEYIAHNTTRSLQQSYLNRALEHVRQRAVQAGALTACEALLKRTRRGMQAIIFARWMRWRLRHREMVKRKIAAFTLMRNSEKGSMILHWNKFVEGIQSIRMKRMKDAAAHAMLTSTANGHRRYVVVQWRRFVSHQKQRRQQKLLVDTMARASDGNLSRLYAGKWLQFVQDKQALSLEEQYAQTKAHNDEMQAAIDSAEAELPSENELDALLAEAQKELAQVEREVKEETAHVEEHRAEEATLQKKLKQSVHCDPNQSLRLQMDTIAATLKPTALHCRKHLTISVDIYQKLSTVTAAAKRGSATRTTSGKTSSPAALSTAGDMFVASMAAYRSNVKDLLAKYARSASTATEGDPTAFSIKEGAFWVLDPDLTVAKIDNLEAIRRLLKPFRECLVLWDHLTVSANPIAGEALTKSISEFVENATWSMELLKREKQIVAGGAASSAGAAVEEEDAEAELPPLEIRSSQSSSSLRAQKSPASGSPAGSPRNTSAAATGTKPTAATRTSTSSATASRTRSPAAGTGANSSAARTATSSKTTTSQPGAKRTSSPSASARGRTSTAASSSAKPK